MAILEAMTNRITRDALMEQMCHNIYPAIPWLGKYFFPLKSNV